MTNNNLKQLRQIVRDEIALSMEEGGGKVREIAQSICGKHPEAISQFGEKLAEDAIANMVRKQIKKWSTVGQASSEQMVLPDMAEHRLPELPAAISIPSDKGGDDDIIYRPLSMATVEELELHRGLLHRQIKADSSRLEAIDQLLQLLHFHKTDASTAIGKALAAISSEKGGSQ